MGDERDGEAEHEGENVASVTQDDRQSPPRGPPPAEAGPPPAGTPPRETGPPREAGWQYTPHPAHPAYGYPPPVHAYPHYPAPPPGYYPEAGHEAGHHRGNRPPRLEYNESGGCSLVAERVPPSVNKFEMLHAHFASLGQVLTLQLNHNRHEAVVTYATLEEAHRALMYPVLQDPDIGLRPWRSKPGQRGPPGTTGEKDRDRDRTNSSAHSIVAHSPGGQGKGSGAALETRQRTPEKPLGNLMLETPHVLEKKRKTTDMEDRRKALLQNLTDQLKTVLTKLNDPKITDKNRETLQVLLSSIRQKIDNVTPPQREIRASRPKLGPQTSDPKQIGDAAQSSSSAMAPAPAFSSLAAASSSVESPAQRSAEAPAPIFDSPSLPPAALEENADAPVDVAAKMETSPSEKAAAPSEKAAAPADVVAEAAPAAATTEPTPAADEEL